MHTIFGGMLIYEEFPLSQTALDDTHANLCFPESGQLPTPIDKKRR